jgi:xanthine dehydrogenase accessory factor
LQLSPDGIEFEEDPATNDYRFEFKSEEDWLYSEKIGYKNHLYIIGGGHCALAFSKIMSMMDFYIRLYDERKGLNTMEQNEWVNEKILVNGYEALKEFIPSDPSGFVVIMTFGYRTDAVALKGLLDKKFKYLGLLGSKKKIEEMFSQFRQEGVPDEVLKNIHSPIGISIKSQTPEEIAISIAAEIIAVKNG